MKSDFYKYLLILVFILGIIFNIFMVVKSIFSPMHTVINITLLFLIVILSFYYGKTKKDEEKGEKFGFSGKHNWRSNEDPDWYLQNGKQISGTVYSDFPDEMPGLGWII
jgi:hypothetical protein